MDARRVGRKTDDQALAAGFPPSARNQPRLARASFYAVGVGGDWHTVRTGSGLAKRKDRCLRNLERKRARRDGRLAAASFAASADRRRNCVVACVAGRRRLVVAQLHAFAVDQRGLYAETG